MNIYNFIESETIRKHLQNCNKPLSIMDCAEIICKNYNISIEEKLKAYQELIDTMEDVEIKFEQLKSAKELLNSIITLHSKLLEEINSKKYDCHVTFYYEPYENKKYTTTYMSKNYKKLITDELANEYDGLKYIVLYVEKLKLKGLINANGTLVEIDHKDVNPIDNFIKQNYLSLTLPFNKGDIIILKRLKGCSFDPFVLEEIKYSKKGTICSGYSIDNDLYSKEYSEDDILNLYYYTDNEDVAQYQYLKALSLFVQGKISESELSKIRDFARIKIKQDEMIAKFDFNENTREILYNLMG